MPEPSSSPRRSPSLWCRGCLFRLLAILLGLAPLALAELALRIARAGAVSEIHDPYVGFAELHPLFVRSADGQRYETAPGRRTLFHPDSFAAIKDPREFRVFVLGGSTVQGSPYTIETSFTTWLELSLSAAQPDRPCNVVNCGGLSYASYRLVPILAEVLGYRPDLVILCTGQNEFLESRTYARVRRMPGSVARAHAWLSRLRTYNVCRRGWLWLTGQDSEQTWAPRTRLPAEVDALLDSPGGLAAYHRDDGWRAAVVEHYRFNLQRMVLMTRRAGVPLVFVSPVSNLKDCPPFKIEARSDLPPPDRERFDKLWNAARALSDRDLARRTDLLQQALAIDDRHAGAWFLLGRCHLAAGRLPESERALIRAKDEDVCPLRMLEAMHDALREVAQAYRVPLVDARALFREHTPDGILGNELLLDHVHPTISGHQLIAHALLERLTQIGLARLHPGWEDRRQEAYRSHLGSLDTPYYARAKERLEGQRLWTEGRARKLAKPAAPK